MIFFNCLIDPSVKHVPVLCVYVFMIAVLQEICASQQFITMQAFSNHENLVSAAYPIVKSC